MRITLTNDFHNTAVNLNCDVQIDAATTDHPKSAIAYPSATQIKRAKRELCGSPDCTCSNEAGTRGRQDLPDGTHLTIDLSPAYQS